MKTTKSLFPWFFGAPRPEKETTQPQSQTINPMEQHQTQPQTKRKPQNPKSRLRLFSPLTNIKPITILGIPLAFLAVAGMLLAPISGSLQAHEAYCYETYPQTFPSSPPSCECSTNWDPPEDYPLPYPTSPDCSPKVFRYVPASPIDRCLAVSHPDHHDDSYYKNCRMKKNINVWEQRCIPVANAKMLYACLIALLTAQSSCPPDWKKQNPVAKGLCIAAVIAAIAACRPCGVQKCVATTRIVGQLKSVVVSNGECDSGDSTSDDPDQTGGDPSDSTMYR